MARANDVSELIRRIQQQEREQVKGVSRIPLREPAPIHCSALPDPASGSPLATEWDHYRREVARLLAEGHEGKWGLIKGEEIVGVWNTQEEADQVRIERYLMQPVLLKQILTWEPALGGGGCHR
jgi:hypothetical protein